MISLNLIPMEKRTEFSRERGENFVLFFAVLSLFFFVVTILFVSLDAVLASSIGQIVPESAASYPVRAQARDLTVKVAHIGSVQGDFIFFSDAIHDAWHEVGPDIDVEQLYVDSVNDVIRLQGTVPAIETIYTLKSAFETSERFSNVKLSVEEILSGERVHFDLSAKTEFTGL